MSAHAPTLAAYPREAKPRIYPIDGYVKSQGEGLRPEQVKLLAEPMKELKDG